MTDDELRDLLRQSAEETRRHFDVAVEDMRSDIHLLSEGLGARVDHLQSRTAEGFDEIKVEFDETKALIRLSYAQLDRRI